jgi:hypothetical protein
MIKAWICALQPQIRHYPSLALATGWLSVCLQTCQSLSICVADLELCLCRNSTLIQLSIKGKPSTIWVPTMFGTGFSGSNEKLLTTGVADLRMHTSYTPCQCKAHGHTHILAAGGSSVHFQPSLRQSSPATPPAAAADGHGALAG